MRLNTNHSVRRHICGWIISRTNKSKLVWVGGNAWWARLVAIANSRVFVTAKFTSHAILPNQSIFGQFPFHPPLSELFLFYPSYSDRHGSKCSAARLKRLIHQVDQIIGGPIKILSGSFSYVCSSFVLTGAFHPQLFSFQFIKVMTTIVDCHSFGFNLRTFP